MMFQRGIGVVYLDDSANIIEKNGKADEILDSTSRLWRKGKRLCLENLGIKQKLMEFGRCDNSEKGRAQFYLKKGLDRAPISLSVFPIVDDLRGTSGENSRWLMLVKDTEKKPDFSADSMARFYGLTNAEVALVIAIYRGFTLAEHAQRRGIKITTVRWTLDNVFSKTYTHSQTDLRELANKFVS